MTLKVPHIQNNQNLLIIITVIIMVAVIATFFGIPSLSISLPIVENQWYSGTINGQTVSGIYKGSDIYFVVNEKANLQKAAQALPVDVYGTSQYTVKGEYTILITNPQGTTERFPVGFVNMKIVPGVSASYINTIQTPSYEFHNYGGVEYLNKGYPTFKFTVPDSASSVGKWIIADEVKIYSVDVLGTTKSVLATADGSVSFYAFDKPATQICDPSRQQRCQNNAILTCNFGTDVAVEACGSKQCKELSTQTASCVSDASDCSVGQVRCVNKGSYDLCINQGSATIWSVGKAVPDGKYCENNQFKTIPTICSNGANVGSCVEFAGPVYTQGKKCILQNYAAVIVDDSSCATSGENQTVFCSDGTKINECNGLQRCNLISNVATMQDDFTCASNQTIDCGIDYCSGTKILAINGECPFYVNDNCEIIPENCTKNVIVKEGKTFCFDCASVNWTYDATNKKCVIPDKPGGLTQEQVIILIVAVIVLIIGVYAFMTKKKK